ncbi:MAG TPA: HAD family phosphatase [Planctomycetes bacterium]|nr:HAD family phosphatase [Planctomycetota bacterium]
MNFQNKHFLFDFDGVLSKSPDTLFEAWSFAFRRVGGVNIEKCEYFLLEGIGVQKTVGILGEKYNVKPSDYSTIIRLKNDYFRKNYSFTLYEGVSEILTKVRTNGSKTALVTGADKHRILQSVPKDFINHFDVVVTSDDIVNTKPDPEPYIKAAGLLGVEPADCVVLENAPLGIQAAKAAGMFVIAFKSTLSDSYLSDADLILESIIDLLDIIKTDMQEI